MVVFSQVGKHHFAYIARKELRRLWRQIPTKIGKPQPSSVMRPWTTPISTVHLCIDPNPNRSFRRLRVARVRCESAIYSWNFTKYPKCSTHMRKWFPNRTPKLQTSILLPSYYSITYSHPSFPAKHHPLASCYWTSNISPWALLAGDSTVASTSAGLGELYGMVVMYGYVIKNRNTYEYDNWYRTM